MLAACVLRLLSQLREPLIPPSSYTQFVNVTTALGIESTRENAITLLGLINELPLPNRHTLALLMRHWLR